MAFKAAGSVIDNYREHVTVNGGTYSTGTSDDYRTSANIEGTPSNTGRTHDPAYNPPSAPSAPAITNNGAAGATRYDYQLEAVSVAAAVSAKSAAGTTATGNATLDGTNNNSVAIPALGGNKYYKVYRSFAGGTPSSLGFIGTATATPFVDSGLPVLTDPDPMPNSTPSFPSWGAALRQGGDSWPQRDFEV
jgi:hypothetical protein